MLSKTRCAETFICSGFPVLKESVSWFAKAAVFFIMSTSTLSLSLFVQRDAFVKQIKGTLNDQGSDFAKFYFNALWLDKVLKLKLPKKKFTKSLKEREIRQKE